MDGNVNISYVFKYIFISEPVCSLLNSHIYGTKFHYYFTEMLLNSTVGFVNAKKKQQ